MASKNIQSLINSLDRGELEATYEIPALRELRALLRMAEENLSEEGINREEIEKEIAGYRDRIDELTGVAAGKPIPFVFRKLNSRKYTEAMEYFNTELDTFLNDKLKNDGERRREQLRIAVENERMLDPDHPEEAENRAKALMAESLLAMEGKTEAWAEDIDDLDPAMQLSEEQEKEWDISPDMPEEEYAVRLAQREEVVKAIKDAKRANIKEERERDIEDRRKEILNQDSERIIANLVVREFQEAAQRHAAMRLQDYFLAHCACNPNEMETVQKGGTTRKIPKRHFTSVEEITALRETDDEIELDLYAWMLEKFNDLQEIASTGDVRRVAESATFPETV